MTASIKQFYGLTISILLLTFYIVYYFPAYFALIIPCVCILGCLFLLSLEKVFLLIAFCTPLSVKIMFGTAGINFPDEPLMLAFTAIFILKFFENPGQFKFLSRNSLAILITIDFLWITITSLSSTLPLVSLKFLIAHLWFITTGFIWGYLIFKNFKNIHRFIIAYGFGLCITVLYTSVRHWQHAFSQKSGTWVMNPFFDDHTVYSATCSIVFIFVVVLLLKGQKYLSSLEKIALFTISCFSLTGIILSYSRAAWLSICLTLVFSLILKFRIKFSALMITASLIAVFVFIFQNQIYQQIRFNKAASGKSFQSDLKSISNVKTDESNVERLNRWESGWRMFKEKPVLGFGPGTYQFNYSSYQRAHQMTSISTTTGDMGSIHSEYLRPLIESGVLGLITFLLLVLSFIKLMMNVIYKTKSSKLKLYATASLLSLFSYLCHGALNNFLDQDKAALLFWSILGLSALVYDKNLILKNS